jgi:hypothetical protein
VGQGKDLRADARNRAPNLKGADMENKTEIERLKSLLRSVSEAIDPVLMRFDGTDKHNDVLLPLCNIGMEIDEALAPPEVKPSTSKPTLCQKHG